MHALDTSAAKPPYRLAFAVFAAVLAGYVVTLAPSVTFWDAGELIAAAKILGIPHPPGTPLFVLMGHVWGSLVPIGEFAYRTNLLTAIFSATAAAMFFLLVAQSLRGSAAAGANGEGHEDPVFTYGGAVAAAIVSAFTFTVWQNSNETEVYMVSTFSIAAISWLAWAWRAHRGGERAAHVLLLIVYLAAVSLGNHLLTLLVGPALLGFMWHVLRTEPLGTDRDRAIEWAQWAVVLGVWALLIGVGLGSKGLLVIGGIVFVVAAAYAASVGALPFAATVVAIALIGASTYLFLLFRAKVGPVINEADPSTWSNLWAVIAREQYPPRSPIDNPIYTTRDLSGVERLGAFVKCLFQFKDGPVPPDEAAFGIPACYTVRSIPLMFRQVQTYLQYFDWQWSNGLAPFEPVFARIRLPFTLAFMSLGVYGAHVLKRRDRSVFWMLLILFLTMSIALVGYMNFKPGYSLSWDLFPVIEMHEVRERDYFFTVSFQVWGLFVGIGLAGLYAALRDRYRAGRAAAGIFLVAALPFALNFTAASRAHGPEARLARDFAFSLLQSAEPYGIVFTNGDNDTFPLWYLQEVEGVRQDVVVVNLSLGNTDWYIRQLRDNPERPFDPEQAPWFAPLAPATPPGPVLTLTDEQIDQSASMLLPQDYTFRAGRMMITYPAESAFYVYDMLMIRLLQENAGKRPLYFSMTAGTSNWSRLSDYVTQEAMLFRVHAVEPPDSTRLAPGIFQVPIDVPRTDSLVWNVYRYADLLTADSVRLDPTHRNIAINLSYPFYGLGLAYEMRGDTAQARKNVANGVKLYYLPEIARALQGGTGLFLPTPADTGNPQ
jgi:hypothetical protein